jgi:hypothetical protein
MCNRFFDACTNRQCQTTDLIKLRLCQSQFFLQRDGAISEIEEKRCRKRSADLGRQSGFISWRLSLARSENPNRGMTPSGLHALSRIVQHSNRMTLNFWGRKLRRNKGHHLVSFLEKCGFCHVSIAAPRLCLSDCPDILGKSNHSRPGPQTSKIIRTGPDYEPWVAVNDRIQAVCEHFKRMDWDCGTVICWSEFKNRSSESKSQPISSQWGGQNRATKAKSSLRAE